MNKGKRTIDNKKLIQSENKYEPKEAVDLLLSTKKANFDESVELHFNLGVDGKRADQQIRGVMVLPHGTGKKKKVLAIVKPGDEDAAKQAKADVVGGEEIINKINSGWLDFDVCVTTPDMMSKIGKIAKILGPKGLMPNPKSGTVTTDLKTTIKEIKAGKVEYRLDKTNNMHLIIGKRSFGAEKIHENLLAVIEEIAKSKPASSKGIFFKNIAITTTMGPSVKINYQTK